MAPERNVRIILVYQCSTTPRRVSIDVWGIGLLPRHWEKTLGARSGPPTVNRSHVLVGSRVVGARDTAVGCRMLLREHSRETGETHWRSAVSPVIDSNTEREIRNGVIDYCF